MSSAHLACRSMGSTEMPMIFTLRLSNSGLILAMYPSSVVHTGVKSLGCENSTAQEFPIQLWNLMGPAVVCASKSGAVSPMRSVIVGSPLLQAPPLAATRVLAIDSYTFLPSAINPNPPLPGGAGAFQAARYGHGYGTRTCSAA